MRILTTAAHTPYLYLLSKTGDEYYVLGKWNEKQRPKPQNVFVVAETEAIQMINRREIDIFLSHNQFRELSYILRALSKKIPTILIFHGKKQRAGVSGNPLYYFLKNLYVRTVTQYFRLVGVRFVFIQPAVKWSYGFPGDVIEPGIDVNEMLEWNPKSSEKVILIVGNDLHRHHFAHEYIDYLLNVKEYNVKIVGKNKRYVSQEANSFEELKKLYATSYVYLNLLKEPECGYNLSMLEAMATGLPVITLYHPESPVRHYYNGLVFRNIDELRLCLREIFSNEELARKLGNNARETVSIFYDIKNFIENWKRVFSEVQEKVR